MALIVTAPPSRFRPPPDPPPRKSPPLEAPSPIDPPEPPDPPDVSLLLALPRSLISSSGPSLQALARILDLKLPLPWMVSKISGGGFPLLLVCVNLELRTIALADDVLMNLTSVGSTVVLFGGLFVASMRSLTAVCSSPTAVCSLAVVCSPLSIIRLSPVWSSLFSQYFLLYGVNWMNKRRWYCKDLPPSDCSSLRLVQYVWSYGLH
ncbi:BnaCnng43050D [Brassica napus]|uniref:BnaCnng43050D protein n=1 Tax=Brassica napus TaxID=3708 RepID=A0A078JCJ8_BRANA|nr:BnaCnng43050D [Brassica napus]